jgi:hypothetical protein
MSSPQQPTTFQRSLWTEAKISILSAVPTLLVLLAKWESLPSKLLVHGEDRSSTKLLANYGLACSWGNMQVSFWLKSSDGNQRVKTVGDPWKMEVSRNSLDMESVWSPKTGLVLVTRLHAIWPTIGQNLTALTLICVLPTNVSLIQRNAEVDIVNTPHWSVITEIGLDATPITFVRFHRLPDTKPNHVLMVMVVDYLLALLGISWVTLTLGDSTITFLDLVARCTLKFLGTKLDAKTKNLTVMSVDGTNGPNVGIVRRIRRLLVLLAWWTKTDLVRPKPSQPQVLLALLEEVALISLKNEPATMTANVIHANSWNVPNQECAGQTMLLSLLPAKLLSHVSLVHGNTGHVPKHVGEVVLSTGETSQKPLNLEAIVHQINSETLIATLLLVRLIAQWPNGLNGAVAPKLVVEELKLQHETSSKKKNSVVLSVLPTESDPESVTKSFVQRIVKELGLPGNLAIAKPKPPCNTTKSPHLTLDLEKNAKSQLEPSSKKLAKLILVSQSTVLEFGANGATAHAVNVKNAHSPSSTMPNITALSAHTPRSGNHVNPTQPLATLVLMTAKNLYPHGALLWL